MEIVAVYEKDRKSLVAFDTSVMTLTELIAKSDINRHFYITIRTTNSLGEFTDHDLDLSSILQETPLGKCADWTSLLALVTESILESYGAVIPDISGNSSLSKRPIVVNVSNYEDITVGYTSIQTPDVRNIFQRRWTLPDLVLTNYGSDNIDFRSSLCSVNGVMTYPYFFEQELYLKDGAKNLWSCAEPRNADIVLFDTKPLGGHQLVRFSECSKVFKNTEQEARPDSDIEIILPEGHDLTNKTVFVVIANRLYFHDQVKVISKRSVLIAPAIMPIHTSMLLRQQAQSEYLKNTGIVESTETVAEYITKTMWSEDHFGAFLVIINNPSVVINRVKCPVDLPNHTVRCINPEGGILVRSKTGQLVSFVQNDYNTDSLLYLNATRPLYRLDTPKDGIQYGMEKFDCVHPHQLTDYADSSFEMVHLFA